MKVRVDLIIQACNELKLPLKIVGVGKEEEALKKIVPPAQTENPVAVLSSATEAPASTSPEQKKTSNESQKPPRKPPALPEHKLRDMLEVKEIDGHN